MEKTLGGEQGLDNMVGSMEFPDWRRRERLEVASRVLAGYMTAFKSWSGDSESAIAEECLSLADALIAEVDKRTG